MWTTVGRLDRGGEVEECSAEYCLLGVWVLALFQRRGGYGYGEKGGGRKEGVVGIGEVDIHR